MHCFLECKLSWQIYNNYQNSPMITCKLIQDNFQTNISLQIILIDPSSKYYHGISIMSGVYRLIKALERLLGWI